MSAIVPNGLPAINKLKSENILLIDNKEKNKKNFSKLNLIILNLMPQKIITEIQLLRILSNFPIPINVEFLKVNNYISKNTPKKHLDDFYHKFKNIRKKNFDGLIITGAPLGLINFNNVIYWNEIIEIVNWAKNHVKSTMCICWAAQAVLNILYKTPKKIKKKKFFGIFTHKILNPYAELTRGFDDIFFVPHSRYSDFSTKMLYENKDLEILAISDMVGAYLFSSKNKKFVFVTGHPEYERFTLLEEYQRDYNAGLNPVIPFNYFNQNNPKLLPYKNTWRSHSNLLFSNWLMYYVI